MKRYDVRQIPDLNLNVVQNPETGFWSVVIPVERTNMITNPSVELSISGYNAVNSSLSFPVTHQYHGARSLAISPMTNTSAGTYYGTVSLTSGTVYAISCKVLGTAGVPYKFSVATTGGVDLTAYTFKGTDRWQWIWIIWNETSSTTRRIYISKNGSASTATFYLDGLQCEACASGQAWPTTYIDGDQQGYLLNQYPPAYYWTGTPHASTSVRSALTRSGGRVVNLQTMYRFFITAAAGLGLATPTNISLQFSQLDGAQYHTTIAPSRQFSISGTIDATTPAQTRRLLSDIAEAVGYATITPRQPCRLIYQPYRCNDAAGDAVDVVASYAGGLEGVDSASPRASTTLTFTQWLPYVSTGSGGAVLSAPPQSLPEVGFILQRSPTGTWATLGTGVNLYVNALALGPDGCLYVGGLFTTAGGAPANYIAKWDGSTWSPLDVGVNNPVYALTFDSQGILYVGGSFTTAGGATANRIAKWDGATWSHVGATATDLNGGVRALRFNRTGTLFVGGEFTNAGGVAAADRIASWNGSAWAAVGASVTGADASVYAIRVDRNDNVYACGNFTSIADGAGGSYISMWNGSTWSALGAAADGWVWDIDLAQNGTLYAAGWFTSIGGIDANHVAQWNGVSWSPVGAGVNGTVYTIRSVPSLNTILIGGVFTASGTLTLPDSAALWNGSIWVPLDIDPPGITPVNTLVSKGDGTIYVAVSSNSPFASGIPTTVTVTNTGTAVTYPVVRITGPSTGTSRIYQITNYTTKKTIYLNYTINSGEVAVLSLDPKNITFTSDFQGNIISKILPGSNTSDFALLPGNNILLFFADSATVNATIEWPIIYQSLNDATW